MKQLNVTVQEDLIRRVKQYAVQNGITMQEAVAIAIGNLKLRPGRPPAV